MEMGLYGLPCVAQLFDHKLEGVCKELGFKHVDTPIAVKAPLEGGRAQAIVMNWIDDLLTGALPKEHKVLQETLNKKLGFGSVCVIGEGSERQFSEWISPESPRRRFTSPRSRTSRIQTPLLYGRF
eukprot:Cvel_815.t2-p1 / transcript=Cvel_815.t2 / gene=Cvel_815 / organism=Chromera_velia_CCMP2878 / gene_product=hypothetical protein / transcript_product=hypothetical protein / location=Cvel_scaffold25:120407-120781(-) / protein_length=125 / sequence_SO=supercontig / SO=protein_coding / is_pseudo=false